MRPVIVVVPGGHEWNLLPDTLEFRLVREPVPFSLELILGYGPGSLAVGISVYGVKHDGSYWYPGGLDLQHIVVE